MTAIRISDLPGLSNTREYGVSVELADYPGGADDSMMVLSLRPPMSPRSPLCESRRNQATDDDPTAALGFALLMFLAIVVVVAGVTAAIVAMVVAR